ncbi:MAG: MaoC family dehydratase [Rhodospirillales bacterium]|nr:MaoC family dehydratase [Rhodospirillales bacterium]
MREVGHRISDIDVGMTSISSKVVTEADIVAFAEVSGDFNPVHMDQAYAKTTLFKGRIAHGMLSAAYISTVLGTQLPGPGCVYLSQSLKFEAPVRIGDAVEAKVEVIAVDREQRRVTLTTLCQVGKTVVVKGEAELMLPADPKTATAA